MKTAIRNVLLSLPLAGTAALSQQAPPPVSREFRAIWVATVANIDWPSRPGLNAWQQQLEMLAILNKAVELRLNAVILQVSSKTDANEESKTRLIKKLGPAEHETIKKNLDQILEDVKEPTALNKLILAGFYEENKLIIDAITAYEEAIKLAPDVPEYKEAYDDFLIRNNLVQ